MKKKIIIASAALFFALATMFNINALQTNNAGDISLDNIAIMAQAQIEYGGSTGLCHNHNLGWCVWTGGFHVPGSIVALWPPR